MSANTRERLLERLEQVKGRFGPPHAAHVESLLAIAARRQFRDPESLIRFHEVLLFLRAFPPSASVLRQAEALLFSFHQRVEALRAAGEGSGFDRAYVEKELITHQTIIDFAERARRSTPNPQIRAYIDDTYGRYGTSNMSGE